MTADHVTGRAPALSDLGSRSLPDRVLRQVHRIGAGERLDCPAALWTDALVLLEVGCVDLRAGSGAGLHLCAGAVFSLRDLTPAVLRPIGPDGAVVVTLRRRTEGEAA